MSINMHVNICMYFTGSLRFISQSAGVRVYIETPPFVKPSVHAGMFTCVRCESETFVCVCACVCVCVRVHLSGLGNHQRLHYNQPHSGREPFIQLSDPQTYVKSCLYFHLQNPSCDAPSAQRELGQNRSWTAAQCAVEHEQGLVSKHFLGPDSSLMRILIAVTHADEGSMGQAQYSDMC